MPLQVLNTVWQPKSASNWGFLPFSTISSSRSPKPRTKAKKGHLDPPWSTPPILLPFWQVPTLHPIGHLFLSDMDPSSLTSSCGSNPMERVHDLGKQVLCHSHLLKPLWGAHLVPSFPQPLDRYLNNIRQRDEELDAESFFDPLLCSHCRISSVCHLLETLHWDIIIFIENIVRLHKALFLPPILSATSLSHTAFWLRHGVFLLRL